jgi:hypothetical protein
MLNIQYLKRANIFLKNINKISKKFIYKESLWIVRRNQEFWNMPLPIMRETFWNYCLSYFYLTFKGGITSEL